MQRMSRHRLSRPSAVILLCLVVGGLPFCQSAAAQTPQLGPTGPADAQPLSPVVPEPDEGDTTLQPGDSGPRVDALNARLQKLSYLPAGPRPTVYDWNTRAAVFAFQRYTRIEETGIAGPLTQRRLAHTKKPTFRGGRRAQVDLRRQLVFLIAESGRVLRTVSVSTGFTGFDTPRGRFHIYRKSIWSWSYPYKVWMAYASYVVRGIAFHEGDLSTTRNSHGCIQIAQEFAKELYKWLRMGTTVVIKGKPKN